MNENIKQLIDLSVKIATNDSDHNITIYGIQDKNTGKFINHKGRVFYITREDARSIRRNMQNPSLRVMKANFINCTDWKTSK